ncbi:MAG: HAMP domain-containing histidine kinase [bacterium]|nr:HAMP domain-containing histidine kinase [bacterium]
MKPKLIIVLALIVIAPLAVVGWLGARIVRDQQVVVEHGLRELMLGQLRAVEAVLARSMENYEQVVLDEMVPPVTDIEELRKRTRESPYVLQYYLLDADGVLLFPPVRAPASLTTGERESLGRTSQIWASGALLGAEAEASPQSKLEEAALAGWHAWYWGSGLQMMLWKQDGEHIHAAEINRTRLLAELIAALPETDVLAPELADGRIRLVDSKDQALYQWGSFEPAEDAAPVATVTLGAPLGAWSLEYHAPGAVFGSAITGGFLLNLAAALAVIGGAVIGLTYYFYREQSRELREAAQRVSFVNQVSHELKTPLTNIRLYAELLEKYTDEQDEPVRRHLDVIVSESQRLSRLIGNVLTFSRKQRRALELHRRPGIVDDVLRAVLDHFGPALAAKEIHVEFAPAAGEAVSFDADAVEQIVGNLISNVEKYGAGGKHLELVSRQRGETTEITVADRGPGLPQRERQRIFEPFYRVSSAQRDGVAGTGIGLTISRELARLHGGELELEPSEQGARFRVTLHCPTAAADG